jgi:hypothetical protein
MNNLLLFLFLVPASAQSPKPAEQCQCSIEVTVKQASGAPLRDATVALSNGAADLPPRMQSTPGSQTILTDGAGHAVFRNLGEGRYRVSVQLEGYFNPPKNSVSTDTPSVIVDVGPEASGTSGVMAATGRFVPGGVLFTDKVQPVHQLEFTMIPGGVISGRLTDSSSQPQSGVSISAFKVTYIYGQRRLIQAGKTAITDDRGEYRLFWLSPGEYYIQAQGPAGKGAQGSSIPVLNYYPGTFESSMAVPVRMQIGQEQSQINFSPIWPSGVTISGTVTNNLPGGVARPNGQVNRNITAIYVQQRNSNLFSQLLLDPSRVMRPASNNPNVSTFEIPKVPPGTYDVYFVFRKGPLVSDNAIGRAVIHVGTTDIPDIEVSINSGVDLAGHVTITGNDPSDTASRLSQMPRFYITSAESLSPTVVGLASTAMNLDREGRFILNHINEGRYYIVGGSDLPDAYVSDLKLGSQSFYSEGSFEIGNSTPEPLEIVVNRNGGAIQGTVVDEQRHPIAGAEVSLIPDSLSRANHLLYRSASSAADGSFSLRGIAPGSYKLFAWQESVGGAEENSEFIKEYEDLGVTVVVKSGVNEGMIAVPVVIKK